MTHFIIIFFFLLQALIITFEGNNVIIGCINVQLHKLLVKWTKNHTELTGERYTTFENGSLRIRFVLFYYKFKKCIIN